MSPRPCRFVHRGAVVEVPAAEIAAAPTRTVLEWLREDARRTGTKEGCAEGDCGACTVVVAQLDARGEVELAPVNACIRFLPTLDGKALFTVEDIAAVGAEAAAAPAALHPVQQSLVDHHGSQCGFCTPGFVMSLWACYERHRPAGTRPTRRQLADDLAGNLCRCTGYRPILDAGEQAFVAEPARLLAREPLKQALRALQADPPLAIPGCWHAPRTAAELAALRLALPQARLVAGATDVGLWVTKQLRELGEIVSLGDVAELRRVTVDDGALTIGAAATLEAAWQALAGEWPALREVYLRFASRPVREAGTLVGNVANGSPIGDAAPVLMALGATLHLRRGSALRRLPLDGFYTGYMANRLEPGEFVEAVEVPRAAAAHGRQVRAYKVSKRHDSDISALLGAFALTLDGAGRVAEARLVFGGMAATVRRAERAEAALVGREWNEAAVAAAAAALADDFQPIDDLRASAAYRRRVAGNLLRRFWLETRPVSPLPPAATSVWAHAPA